MNRERSFVPHDAKTEAIVTNRAQTSGKDMAQIAPHELDPGECERFHPVVVGTILPTEGDGVDVDVEDA